MCILVNGGIYRFSFEILFKIFFKFIFEHGIHVHFDKIQAATRVHKVCSGSHIAFLKRRLPVYFRNNCLSKALEIRD